MNPAIEAPAALDALLAPLLHLPPAARLEVIARLAQSLQASEVPVAATQATAALPSFIGAWAGDPEADHMEQAILASRHFATKDELTQWS